MARQAQAIPKAWKDTGVLYVSSIDGQWDQVDEYAKLGERSSRGEKLDAKEFERLEELRVAMRELLMARIQPYSGEEFARLQGQRIQGAMEFKVTGGVAKMKGADPQSLASELAIDVVEKRVLELFNYSKAEPELDESGAPVFDDHGNVVIKSRSPIKDGAELAKFVRSPECWESERAVIDDLFTAIQSRSHLEAGVKKASASRRDFSPPATRL